MSFKTVNPTTTQEWAKLQNHFEELKNVHLQNLFAQNKNREQELSIVNNDFYGIKPRCSWIDIVGSYRTCLTILCKVKSKVLYLLITVVL